MQNGATGGPAGCRLYFEADGKTVSTEIKDPTLFEKARRLFPFYEITAPTVEASAHPDVKVEAAPHGYVVTTRAAPPSVCGTDTEALSVLEFELTRAILTSFASYVHLHAAGAVVSGKSILALGKSGAGKSSLAVSWLTQGLPIMGDDIVFVNEAAVASPFKRLLKVAPVALEALGIDPAKTIQWDPEWPEAWYDPENRPGWAAAAPVGVVAVVCYDPTSSLTLTPLSKTDALNAVVHSVMDTGRRAVDCFDALVRLVEGARVYTVEYSAAADAAEAISSLVK